MATLEVAFLHSQLEERKRPWEAAIALTPQKAGLAGLLREARLLHLLDEEKRRELMINYGGDRTGRAPHQHGLLLLEQVDYLLGRCAYSTFVA